MAWTGFHATSRSRMDLAPKHEPTHVYQPAVQTSAMLLTLAADVVGWRSG